MEIGNILADVAELLRAKLPQDRLRAHEASEDGQLKILADHLNDLSQEELEAGQEAKWDALRARVLTLTADRPLYSDEWLDDEHS